MKAVLLLRARFFVTLGSSFQSFGSSYRIERCEIALTRITELLSLNANVVGKSNSEALRKSRKNTLVEICLDNCR